MQMSPKLYTDVVVHGFLFWASMGLLAPLGILVMRKSKASKDQSPGKKKLYFYIHYALQMISFILVTVGAVLSIKDFQNLFNNDHQRLGLALYGLFWIQFLIGTIRPNKGDQGRNFWNFVHWLMGIFVTFLGIVEIYSGFWAYHIKTSRNPRLWVILFTVELSLIILIYIFQEKKLAKRNREANQPSDMEISLRTKEQQES